MTKKLVNGVYMDMTPEEEAQRITDLENSEARKVAEAEAKAQAEADKEAKDVLKASAKAKLIAGEPLTEEEADTIVL